MKKFHEKRKGFTLIELLVVIAIIGILATIVLVSLNTARQKARDARRVGDLRQVALALEMYYDDNTSTGYPGDADALDCDDWTDLVAALQPDYMTAVPTDPGSNAYAYEADSTTNNNDYILRAQTEGIPPDDGDVAYFGCLCDALYYCIKP